jgi:hypothetical protein
MAPEDRLIKVAPQVMQAARDAVACGQAPSVEAYFTAAAAQHRADCDAWAAQAETMFGPVDPQVLEYARRTLETDELVERLDPVTGRYVRVNGARRAG